MATRALQFRRVANSLHQDLLITLFMFARRRRRNSISSSLLPPRGEARQREREVHSHKQQTTSTTTVCECSGPPLAAVVATTTTKTAANGEREIIHLPVERERDVNKNNRLVVRSIPTNNTTFMDRRTSLFASTAALALSSLLREEASPLA